MFFFVEFVSTLTQIPFISEVMKDTPKAHHLAFGDWIPRASQLLGGCQVFSQTSKLFIQTGSGSLFLGF